MTRAAVILVVCNAGLHLDMAWTDQSRRNKVCQKCSDAVPWTAQQGHRFRGFNLVRDRAVLAMFALASAPAADTGAVKYDLRAAQEVWDARVR